MLLVRAPVRISFAGGGTDLPAYYQRFGGLVVSATIDKYFYVFLNPSAGPDIHITSSDYRSFQRWSPGEAPSLRAEPLGLSLGTKPQGEAWDGELRLPGAVLHDFGVAGGFSVFLASEIPPGTGLGSSSTVAVALTKAISTYLGQRLSPAEIAERAARIEIDKLGSPIGKQDQYAAAFGGLNAFAFHADGVGAEPLRLHPEVRRHLEANLLLFYTGASRSANAILHEQRAATRNGHADVMVALHALKGFAQEARTALEEGDLTRFGQILHESWQAKRRLSRRISSREIDALYERARRRGALGGKIAGAGGGGFLLLYCEEAHQPAVCAELAAQGLYRLDFHLEDGGAKVLLNSAAPPPRSASDFPLARAA